MRKTMFARRRFVKTIGCLFTIGLGAGSRFSTAQDVASQYNRAKRSELAHIIETTPLDEIVEIVVQGIKSGWDYDDVIAALTQAAASNLQPYPQVGFKYHGVMLLQSLHLTSTSLHGSEKWFPLLWGIDNFKRSQQRELAQTGWRMQELRARPADASTARNNLFAAMENWDREAAEVATLQLSRSTSPQYTMAQLMTYSARDYRALGHKPITAANALRMLTINDGYAAEAILRSTAAAIVNHDRDTNPADSDHSVDRAWRQNLELVNQVQLDLQQHDGPRDWEAGLHLQEVLRSASDLEAGREVMALLNSGVGTEVIWNALLGSAGEIMLNTGSFVALHANTMINALLFLFLHADEKSGILLTLQSAALLANIRSDSGGGRQNLHLEELESLATDNVGKVFDSLKDNRLNAARYALGFLNSTQNAETIIQLARSHTVNRANDTHDYKYAEAVIENYRYMMSPWRHQYLSTIMMSISGPHQRRSPIIEQARRLLSA